MGTWCDISVTSQMSGTALVKSDWVTWTLFCLRWATLISMDRSALEHLDAALCNFKPFLHPSEACLSSLGGEVRSWLLSCKCRNLQAPVASGYDLLGEIMLTVVFMEGWILLRCHGTVHAAGYMSLRGGLCGCGRRGVPAVPLPGS